MEEANGNDDYGGFVVREAFLKIENGYYEKVKGFIPYTL